MGRNLMPIERHTILRRWLRRRSGRKPRGSEGTPRSLQGLKELEAEKEARRRMQAFSREDRVLQELEQIALGDGPASGRLKALELLGKLVGLFKPREVPEVERSVEDISNQLQRRLEDLLD